MRECLVIYLAQISLTLIQTQNQRLGSLHYPVTVPRATVRRIHHLHAKMAVGLWRIHHRDWSLPHSHHIVWRRDVL
jgi:hypothetical protein